MTVSITMSFVTTTELKRLVEQWAQEDDRSVSYIMRRILEKEAQRRQASPVLQPQVPINS